MLERLPKPYNREAYISQRREERGRPERNTAYQYDYHRFANLKENSPEDIAEWVYEDAVSSYHSFTIPYGPKYHAKKIEKMLYTKDLLLNAGMLSLPQFHSFTFVHGQFLFWLLYGSFDTSSRSYLYIASLNIKSLQS